jgi:hypothetical protein
MNVSYHCDMKTPRLSEIRRRARWRAAEERRKGDRSRRGPVSPAPPSYSVAVTHQRDSRAGEPQRAPEPTPEQIRVAKWFGGVVEAKMAEGWTHTKIAGKAKLSRKDFYRYLDPAQAPKSPRATTIRRICEGLGTSYTDAVRQLGWGKDTEHSSDASERAAFIRRARAIAEHADTSDEVRQDLEERIARAERLQKAAATSRLSADELDREAEALLREVFEEEKDAPGQ